MDPIYAQFLRCLAAAMGASTYTMVRDDQGSWRHWLWTAMPGTLFAIFLEPAACIALRGMVGGMAWFNCSTQESQIGYTYLAGFLGYMVARFVIAVFPDWLRSKFGITPQADPLRTFPKREHPHPDSDAPALRR